MTRVRLRPDLARNAACALHEPPPRKHLSPHTFHAAQEGRRSRTLVGLSAGGVYHRRCPSGFAVILWRRAYADCRPLGAAARFNAIVAAGKSAVPPRNPLHRPFRWPRREAAPAAQWLQQATPSASAKQHPGSGQHAARRRAGSTPQRLPIKPSCCKRSRAISRIWSGTIEQLKANQQQMASDNSKAIGELKASQEEIKRALAKVSEQTPPRASASPPADAAGSGLAQARADVPPQARARPRYYPRGSGYYDDW